ncbi:MAG: hypothetical protein ACTSRZ_03400 [Promethearchaeota archaeon]
MPIRFNWTRGKHLGVALFLFGIMGLIQSLIVIPIGEYILKVGSLYVIIFLPIGVTIGMMYGTQIFYETNIQRSSKKLRKASFSSSKTILGLEKELISAVLTTIAFFMLIFAITYGIVVNSFTPINTFIISENVATIGLLIIASIFESQSGIKSE